MDLSDRIAVVTGGASGLGRAAANHLVSTHGMRVALLDLPSSDGASVAAEMGLDRASFHPVDVSDESQVAATVAAVVVRWGGIHACLNTAGVPGTTRMLSRDGVPCGGDRFARTLAVNLLGTFHVTAHCAAAMASNVPSEDDGTRGVIVNVSSIAAYEGNLGHVAYSASKAGVIGMMLPAARELGPLGIRVMTIAPGLFPTPMAAGVSEKALEAMKSSILYPKRFGHLAEFSSLVGHIFRNGYLNAEVVRIDGGARLFGR